LSTLTELRSHRDTAGAAYAAAYAAFKSAWVTLRAHEIALANAKVASPTSTFGGPSNQPDVIAFRHPEYLTDTGATDWSALAQAAASSLIDAYPTPDEE
jgi:hypothetical protein